MKLLIYDYISQSEIELPVNQQPLHEPTPPDGFIIILSKVSHWTADSGIWQKLLPFEQSMIRWLLSRPGLTSGFIMKQGSVEVRYER